jgi:hypothetical protein
MRAHQERIGLAAERTGNGCMNHLLVDANAVARRENIDLILNAPKHVRAGGPGAPAGSGA